MPERRRYNGRERVALYLAAAGRCSRCGLELQPGWHADHVVPYIAGGATDVVNGQALCPSCNLKKGANVTTLRPWQEAALQDFLGGTRDFLLVAAPATGKTLFALAAAQRTFELGLARRLIVVVPSTHLRKQWANAATPLGIDLDWKFVNGAGALGEDFHGVVTTYQAVAKEPALFRRLASGRPTLVVLDEVHHGGDEQAWGKALTEAFEVAGRRLLLSGTPNRTDGYAIPFVRYDEHGRFLADHVYDYGTALQDHAARPIEFLAMDGQMRYREAGSIVQVDLADAHSDGLSPALQSALQPEGDWIGSVLRRANAELTRHREDVPDAGGLVIAPGQATARAYAAQLERICGETVRLAISEDQTASERIADFTDDNSRWLVTVRMVSEGVDIPRLTVGVFASTYRTDVFFRQVVGRFVRMRGDADETTATLFLPSIAPLLEFARTIEQLVNEALRREEHILREKPDDQPLPLQFNVVEPLDSSEAVHHSTILSGESFTDQELQEAERLREEARFPASVATAQVARLLRLAGAGRVVGSFTVTPTPPPERSLSDEKASLRRLVNRKVARLSHFTDEPFGHIHARLNAMFRDKAATATSATLQARLDQLDQWIVEAP